MLSQDDCFVVNRFGRGACREYRWMTLMMDRKSDVLSRGDCCVLVNQVIDAERVESIEG